MRRGRVTAVVSIATLAASVTAACSGGDQVVDTPEEHTAQERVIAVLNTWAMKRHSSEVADFARAARSAGLDVIQMESRDAAELTDVFGVLTFSVLISEEEVPESGGWIEGPEWDLGPYCFRVPFDSYGKHGEFGTADNVALVNCPEGAAPIELPRDDTPDDGELRGG